MFIQGGLDEYFPKSFVVDACFQSTCTSTYKECHRFSQIDQGINRTDQTLS